MFRLPFKRLSLAFGALALISTSLGHLVGLASADESRPNIVLIVLDDAGHSDLGVFGGEIETPNIDQLAADGCQFTQFHVTPNCSTTRASLMTGMDHHRTGLATHEGTAENQKGKPGYEGYLTRRVATLPEVLRASGYRTVMAGKWHLGNKDPTTWPSARGFDQSFALLGGMSSHWKENIVTFPDYPARFVDNGEPVDPLPDDFYSTDDFTDHIIRSVQADDRPFFAYLAFTAPHNPLHAPAELIAKYSDRYLMGWDQLRDQRLKNLRKLGLLAADARPHDRPKWIPAWDSLDEAARQASARDMAVYAAMIDRIDQNVGRLVDHLQKIGEYDQTCFVVMSDNGPNKTTMADYMRITGGDATHLEDFNNSFNNRGLADSCVDHGPGWAHALAAPLRLMKGYAGQGGIRAPLIIKPPASRNATSDSAHRCEVPVHVMDVMPTLLEVAFSDHLSDDPANELLTMQGSSLWPIVDGGPAHQRRESEFRERGFRERGFGGELFGMRLYRLGDWKIVRLPPPYGNDRWQLYDLAKDPGETEDRSQSEPQRLRDLIRRYENYESENGVVVPDRLLSYAEPPRNPEQGDFRHLPLEGQPNFRDVGGYQTASGASVALGRVFRSGELSRMTESDLLRLQQVGIASVVNFLTEAETNAHGLDRIPEGVSEISLPIETDDNLAATILEARQTADFSKVPAAVNPEIHRMLVDDAKTQYAALFRAIANDDRPLVFHCSHGIHRTGTATAILLWSLGVPWETVRADYLLSNHYRRDEIDRRIEQLRQLAAKNRSIEPEEVDMTDINAFYRLQGNYIDATRTKILEEYGTVDMYLKNGLGLTEAEIDKLRRRMLQ